MDEENDGDVLHPLLLRIASAPPPNESEIKDAQTLLIPTPITIHFFSLPEPKDYTEEIGE